jgi:hypothetical protein
MNKRELHRVASAILSFVQDLFNGILCRRLRRAGFAFG